MSDTRRVPANLPAPTPNQRRDSDALVPVAHGDDSLVRSAESTTPVRFVERQTAGRPADAPTTKAFQAVSVAAFAGMLFLMVIALLVKKAGGNGDPVAFGAVAAAAISIGFATAHDLRVKRIKAAR